MNTGGTLCPLASLYFASAYCSVIFTLMPCFQICNRVGWEKYHPASNFYFLFLRHRTIFLLAHSATLFENGPQSEGMKKGKMNIVWCWEACSQCHCQSCDSGDGRSGILHHSTIVEVIGVFLPLLFSWPDLGGGRISNLQFLLPSSMFNYSYKIQF